MNRITSDGVARKVEKYFTNITQHSRANKVQVAAVFSLARIMAVSTGCDYGWAYSISTP
jgi:hypothetical protein